ncbi:hypothetical protein J4G43_031555 [Bradyrhizobium barranii subsp. barranii]|uniref:Uncharacterized protein n=1 Tax=Bradyrhizobium barranii subsp. barranii TaxID=2823807 RepID=A0A939M9Q3_9BRAD|nr:hypothetical protein [Bradyrhizobium barranii]UEM09264.1 hypothetical protein J4G43_031555 [Bradyrhizobium barranii subsp. barranii]
MEMFILFWFPLSIAVGVYASNKGRSGFGLFLLSVFLSPIVGLLFALALRNKAADQRHAELLEALRKATPPLPAQSISTPEPAVKLFTLKDDTSPVNPHRRNTKGWIIALAVVAAVVAVFTFVASQGSVVRLAERQVTAWYVEKGYKVERIAFRVTSPSTIEGSLMTVDGAGKTKFFECTGVSANGSSYQITCK